MWKGVAAVLVTVLLTFAAGEVALRLYDVAQGRTFAGEAPKVRPYRTFGVDLYGLDGDQLFIQSRHGERFPFDKDDDTVRMVTFGGSTTANNHAYTTHGIHYPMLLERRLREEYPSKKIEVINVGYEGYATTHSLAVLAFDVLSWQPDLVIVSHNFNDLETSYFDHFFPDYSHKFLIDYYTPGLPEFTWLRSRLVRFVRARLLRVKAFNTYPVRRAGYEPLPPQTGRDTFARNLRSFITLAQHNGIDVIVGSQPLEAGTAQDFDEDFRRKSYNDLIRYPEHEVFVRHHQAFNDILRRVAGETGSLFVDNDARLGGRPELFKDFIHYTNHGVEQLAGSYADAIVRSGLLDAGVAPQRIVSAPAS